MPDNVYINVPDDMAKSFADLVRHKSESHEELRSGDIPSKFNKINFFTINVEWKIERVD